MDERWCSESRILEDVKGSIIFEDDPEIGWLRSGGGKDC